MIETGSSSAPARKVSSTAPDPAMNLIHSAFGFNISGSKKREAIYPASAPTQISMSAMDIFSRLASIVERTARASQPVAMVNISSMGSSLK